MITSIKTQSGVGSDISAFGEKARKNGKILDSNMFEGDGSIFVEYNNQTYIIQIRNETTTKISKCSMETYYENQ